MNGDALNKGEKWPKRSEAYIENSNPEIDCCKAVPLANTPRMREKKHIYTIVKKLGAFCVILIYNSYKFVDLRFET